MSERRRKDQLADEPMLNVYQGLASKTAVYRGKDSFQGVSYNIFKLNGEAGEVSEKMGKFLRDGGIEWDSDPKTWSPEVREAFLKEIGDVLWYVANLSKELGFTLQEVAEGNLEKLESRRERGVIHGSGDDR